MPETLTLTEFLLARIAEDEEVARSAQDGEPGRWNVYAPFDEAGISIWGDKEGGKVNSETEHDEPVARHVIAHEPARVLADCEAKRRIVEDATNMHTRCVELDGVVAILAAVYADHPDYRDDWRP